MVHRLSISSEDVGTYKKGGSLLWTLVDTNLTLTLAVLIFGTLFYFIFVTFFVVFERWNEVKEPVGILLEHRL